MNKKLLYPRSARHAFSLRVADKKVKLKQGATIKIRNERSRKLDDERTESMQMKHQASIIQIKEEMAEISADQKKIRAGQREVIEKFKEIESECAHLREESSLISQQSADTQSRLDLMLNILKARQDKNFVQANKLTQCLREMITQQNEKNNTFAGEFENQMEGHPPKIIKKLL